MSIKTHKKLFEGIKMLHVNFAIISIIYKILMLLKIAKILKRSLRSVIDVFLKKMIVFHNI